MSHQRNAMLAILNYLEERQYGKALIDQHRLNLNSQVSILSSMEQSSVKQKHKDYLKSPKHYPCDIASNIRCDRKVFTDEIENLLEQHVQTSFRWVTGEILNGSIVQWHRFGQIYELTEDYIKMEMQMPRSSKGLEVGSIRHIQGIGYGVLEFLGVGITFDILQNIYILYLEYGVLDFSGYGVLSLFPLWSLVSASTDTPYLP
ncbi:hypothetical protein Tco_1315585 [Tanacetum coccineum]